MTESEMIDLLRSLSIIEGAVRGSTNKDVASVVEDELMWCVELILLRLKDR